MKCSQISLALCSLLQSTLVSAVDSAATIFFLDSESAFRPPTHDAQVTPHTAQLLLAQRLGLSSIYDLSRVDSDVLGMINTYGGKPQQLLSSAKQAEESSRILIVVEDIRPQQSGFSQSFSSSPYLKVGPAPHPSQTDQLLADLEHVAKEDVQYASDSQIYNAPLALRELAEAFPGSHLTTHASRTVLHIKSLGTSEQSSEEYGDKVSKITQAITSLRALLDTKEVTSITVLAVPPEHHCAKRTVKTFDLVRHSANGVRQPTEALLSDVPSHMGSLKEETTKTKSHGPKHTSTNTPVLRGPIASCFSSKSACESTTGNCTGHGECSLKYQTDVGSGKKSSCYGCVCNKPEIIKLGDGRTKTTRFGGGACNKKDVSVPFWLLGGTTIFLVTILSWGVGLLYSMGNADLPSVIGAGVTGPRATK